jgi:3-methyl-2-oxobutanoate hydroxymethyltransferase
MKRIKIKDILKLKSKKKIICLTSYTKNFSQILDRYCDIILVGDSLSMVLYGMSNTRQITLETMILHAKTVKKYAKRSLVVFDMPFKSYKNKSLAYKNAKKVIKETKCDAIKLEGGMEISKIIKHLTQKGISVMGHIGLLPQNSRSFKLQGKTLKQKKKIFNDALSISSSGAFAIVIECVVESLAKKITKNISIPTIGIGASKHCDGQILVTEDMIGLTDFSPKFVKKYSNMRKIIEKSVKRYSDDIRNQKFPSSQNVYN